MEFEFDKEIDAILRKARAGEAAASLAEHMDADEISAFAENAVADAARTRYTMHLADCTRCRSILSNTILLNSEAETETASSAVSAAVTEAKTPWYRRLFAFPQLAYTMGAMVLLFSGFFGYLILQNLGSADRAVSYSANKQSSMEKSAPSNASSTAANSNATTTTTTTTNSSVTSIPSASSNASSAANSAPLSPSGTTTAATPAADTKSIAPELNSPVAVPQATPLPAPKTEDKPRDAADRDELAKVSPGAPTATGAANQNRAREEKQKKDVADSTLGDDNKGKNEQESELKAAPMSKTARKQPSNAGETRSVGGKTFNNVGGIWFDSAVGKQKQKTVRRGTSDYLRLDAGLRSIADNLGGTVVILWSGKAYRIQ